jgi:hypothetical protein
LQLGLRSNRYIAHSGSVTARYGVRNDIT